MPLPPAHWKSVSLSYSWWVISYWRQTDFEYLDYFSLTRLCLLFRGEGRCQSSLIFPMGKVLFLPIGVFQYLSLNTWAFTYLGVILWHFLLVFSELPGSVRIGSPGRNLGHYYFEYDFPHLSLSLSLLPLLESSKVMRYCGAFSFFSCSVLQVSFVRSQAWLFLVCLWVCLLIRGWNHGLPFPARQFFLIVSSVPWHILCICPSIMSSYHESHYLNNHANLAAILDSSSDACQPLQTECCALCCASWFSLEGRYDL